MTTDETNKYHTSKIYKISSPQCEKFYIGSTTLTLTRRLSLHKSDYKRYVENGNRGCVSSFEVVKFDDAIIELIKNVKCENRNELERLEGNCILEHHNRILNKNVAGRTWKEYREANKIEGEEYRKNYREANKIKIKEYNEARKNEMKEYREVNKNKLKEYRKEWYEANKNEINDKRKEKYECGCGMKLARGNKSDHEKTKKHLLFINQQL
jgi:hypothetical protein